MPVALVPLFFIIWPLSGHSCLRWSEELTHELLGWPESVSFELRLSQGSLRTWGWLPCWATYNQKRLGCSEGRGACIDIAAKRRDLVTTEREMREWVGRKLPEAFLFPQIKKSSRIWVLQQSSLSPHKLLSWHELSRFYFIAPQSLIKSIEPGLLRQRILGWDYIDQEDVHQKSGIPVKSGQLITVPNKNQEMLHYTSNNIVLQVTRHV